MPDNGRRLIVAANWKMHGSLQMLGEYVAQLTPVSGVELVVFPPSVYLFAMQAALAERATYVAIGAQDVHERASGAFTGEESAEMMADAGARWTIIGHSERRRFAGETDHRIAAKVRAALRAGLQPILCVGESLQERTESAAEKVVGAQLAAMAAAGGELDWQRLIVAYEPVWAIGTGHSARIDQVEDMHGFIRQTVQTLGGTAVDPVVLYGGSVNEKNAEELFRSTLVDGALVGSAALTGTRFLNIARSLQRMKVHNPG